MAEVIRVTATEVRDRVMSGEALLVCAYRADEKFRAHRLDGAISLTELETMLPALDRGRELIFYCA